MDDFESPTVRWLRRPRYHLSKRLHDRLLDHADRLLAEAKISQADYDKFLEDIRDRRLILED